MTRTCSRILTCALALSLLIHLMFAAVIKPIHSVEAAAEQQPSSVRVIVIHTPPPPTPTPVPTHSPKTSHPQANARPRVSPPRAVANKGSSPPEPRIRDMGSEATPGPAMPMETVAPGTPEPTPTPKPACSVPNAPAATVNVVAPNIPDEAGTDVDAQAQVRVTLAPSGAVEAVAMYRSAGNTLLDREALRAARQSTYRAEVRDCVAVRGDYLFTVEFKE